MSRHNGGGSYRHACRYDGDGCYMISWMVDRYYEDSRQRHPTTTRRLTNRVGAERFCKRWKLDMPEENR